MGIIEARRLPNIQALRAVAALMVVAVHLEVALGKLHAGWLREIGGDGVAIFFVISGFIMVWTTQNKAVTPRKFFLNRFCRIAPIYYFLTVASVCIAVAAPHLINTTKGSLTELVKSLLFIPYINAAGRVQPILYVGWTLNYEMFFYLLFSIGLAFRPYATGMYVTIGTLAVLASLYFFGPYNNLYLALYTSPMMLEFVFGMIIALAMPAISKTKALPSIVPYGLMAAGFAGLFASSLVMPADSALTAFAPTVSSAAIVLAALQLETKSICIKNATWILLGDASYSLYLSHPFTAKVANIVESRIHGGPISALITIVLVYVTVSVVAVLLYRKVELPLTKIVRKAVMPLADKPLPKFTGWLARRRSEDV